MVWFGQEHDVFIIQYSSDVWAAFLVLIINVQQGNPSVDEIFILSFKKVYKSRYRELNLLIVFVQEVDGRVSKNKADKLNWNFAVWEKLDGHRLIEEFKDKPSNVCVLKKSLIFGDFFQYLVFDPG